MRRFVYGLLGTVFLMGQATAAESCKNPQDRDIFELAALKSEAMVLATSCHEEERYNAFVQRFKAALQANEHAFDAYFKREFGRSAQTEHDAYVTNLANAQSDVGLKEGTDFCPHTEAMFDEVMAVPTAQELPEYAAGKDLVPANLGDCVAPEPVASRSRAASSHTAVKHAQAGGVGARRRRPRRRSTFRDGDGDAQRGVAGHQLDHEAVVAGEAGIRRVVDARLVADRVDVDLAVVRRRGQQADRERVRPGLCDADAAPAAVIADGHRNRGFLTVAHGYRRHGAQPGAPREVAGVKPRAGGGPGRRAALDETSGSDGGKRPRGTAREKGPSGQGCLAS
jgi:hypothetical protein